MVNQIAATKSQTKAAIQAAQTVIDTVDLTAATARLSGDETATISRVPIEEFQKPSLEFYLEVLQCWKGAERFDLNVVGF